MYCSTGRLEKPTDHQTVKKLPAFYINRIFIVAFQQPSVPSQSSSCLLITFNIILPSTSKSFKWSLFLKFPHQNPHEPLSSVRAIGPTYIIIFDLLTPLIFPEEYNHTCPQLYLQKHHVMLHNVTNTSRHQKAYPQEQDCLTCVYLQSYTLNMGQNTHKKIFLNSRLRRR